MSDLPPIIQAPGPPASSKPLLWILGVLGCGSLVCCSSVVGAGWWAYKRVQAGAQPLAGYGRPTVERRVDASWTRYHFADLGLTIDLPHYPDKELLPVGGGDSLIVSGWAAYLAEGSSCATHLYSYEYNLKVPFKARDYLDGMLLDNQRAYTTTRVSSSYAEREIGGRQATILTSSIRMPDGLAEVQYVGWMSDRKVVLVCFSWWKSERVRAIPQKDRILRSIRFD